MDQSPVEDLPGGLRDAVVIGAGPAGSTAAMRLARRGYDVVLVERRRFPRDKACGDALIPDAIACLERSGLYDRVRAQAFAADRVTIYSPSRIDFDIAGEFLILKRRVLDRILAAAAAEAGATVACGKADAVDSTDDGGVRVRFARTATTLRARVAIFATGADVSLLEQSGMLERAAPSAVAVRCYVRANDSVRRLVMSYDRSILPGYGWIFPLGGGEFNVGCGLFHENGAAADSNPRDLFGTFAASFPPVRRLLDAADEVGTLRGARLRCGLSGARALGSGPVIAIGETIGTTFPFTGEGIGKAMATAEIAAAVVDDALADDAPDRLRAFPDRVEERLRPRYRGYTIAERWLSRAWVSDLVARRARRSRFLRQAMAGILTETVDPRTVFSLRGVLTSLWR